MSHISFLNFEKLAGQEDLTDIVISGRYEFQEEAEKEILLDIIEKLELTKEDSLLEIGCGTGNLLLPLSLIVKEAHGVDNINAISRLIKRDGNKKVMTSIGLFQETNIKSIFSKILMYSVIHYLANFEELISFIEKALNLLESNGALLIGDIPNVDKKARYLSSQTYQAKREEWNLLLEKCSDSKGALNEMVSDEQLIKIGDYEIFEILRFIRGRGFEAFLLPQPAKLPFSYSRDDILIRKVA